VDLLGIRVKPFLIRRAVPVSFSYGGLAFFVLPLGVTVALTDWQDSLTGE